MKNLLSLFSLLCAFTASAVDRPNILYIALEDITPMMGCYGDTYAKTPNFDKLAAESIRYTHAYSVGPVCSVSRSSIVTGMYPTTIGTMHHRSGGVQAPESRCRHAAGKAHRLGTRSEFVRAIRDKRYRYQRNFYPHLPFAPYETYQYEASVYERWGELARQGKLEGAQVEYARRFKPVEQLYDSENDPEMVNNIAHDPAYADVLKQMRQPPDSALRSGPTTTSGASRQKQITVMRLAKAGCAIFVRSMSLFRSC